jgi:dihydrofolate reductase
MATAISMIAAVGEHLELGAANDLMWHLPDDFRWFVNHTKGHPVVMGRKTMESLGKPLKNRTNIVISRNADTVQEGFEHAPNLDAAVQRALQLDSQEIFIIGGGQIYTEAMPMATRLYITRVKSTFPQADTFFPAIDSSWQVVFQELHEADEKHAFAFEFLIFEKAPTT